MEGRLSTAGGKKGLDPEVSQKWLPLQGEKDRNPRLSSSPSCPCVFFFDANEHGWTWDPGAGTEVGNRPAEVLDSAGACWPIAIHHSSNGPTVRAWGRRVRPRPVLFSEVDWRSATNRGRTKGWGSKWGPRDLFTYLFFRRVRLTWNLLCGPDWLQTHRDAPASASECPSECPGVGGC